MRLWIESTGFYVQFARAERRADLTSVGFAQCGRYTTSNASCLQTVHEYGSVRFYSPHRELEGSGMANSPSEYRGRLLKMGIIPIIFALRIAFPSRRCDFHVRFVVARDLILPIDDTKCDSSREFIASSSGLMPNW